MKKHIEKYLKIARLDLEETQTIKKIYIATFKKPEAKDVERLDRKINDYQQLVTYFENFN